MRTKTLRLLLLTGFAALGLATLVAAGGPRAAVSAPGAGGAVQRYIVVLNEPPLAQYTGGIKGLAPTAVEAVAAADPDAAPSVHLDVTSSAAQAYGSYLMRRQRDVMQAVRAVAPEFTQKDWQYQYVLNGFTAQLTSQHADAVRQMQGVRLVFPAEKLEPEMDATKTLVDAITAWEAAGGTSEAGAGARVATMEAGNAVAHQFFNDEGMGEPPAGFPQAKYYLRDGTIGELTNKALLVNNKIVSFKPISDSFTQADIDTLNAGFGTDGVHGTHVAGTITGRWGSYPVIPGFQAEMAGVAPMATLFTYPVYGATPEMVKAFEIMVEDQIDAVNLSLGTTTWLLDSPDHHPVSLAMSGAAAAGVVVVGSAGNAGSNGRTSLSAAWKYNEDVIAVGNTGTNGRQGVNMTLSEPATAPASLKNGTVGVFTKPTTPITGEYAYVAGGGCTASDAVSGKIAVIERFDSNSQAIGGACTIPQRVTNMAAGGAVAVILTYMDRLDATVGATATAIPALALGASEAKALLGLLQAGTKVAGTIDSELQRGYGGVPDYLATSSSRGPGLDWSIKPDISAPGTNIMSAWLQDDNTTDNNPPSITNWQLLSGTSMAAPHITGAVGLLRSMHPDWTFWEIKSALLTTSEPSVTSGPADSPVQADPTQGGPGRLDLSDAWDPKAFMDPAKLSFGKLAPDESKTLNVKVSSAASTDVTWEVSVEQGAGDALITPSTDKLAVPAGGEVEFTVKIEPPAGGTVDEHWGYVVLKETAGKPTIYLPALAANGEFTQHPTPTSGPVPLAPRHEGEHEELRTLRLAYYAYVDLAAARKNVLLIDWTVGPTTDYKKFYTDALDAAGLSYTIYGMGEANEHPAGQAFGVHPPYKLMDRHDLVIFNGNMSNVSMHQTGATGMFQYQNLVLGGGNLLIAGQGTQGWWRYLNRARLVDNAANRAAYPETFPHTWAGASQNVGCEMCLARYFAGFTPVYTSTLSGKALVPFPMPPATPELDVVLTPAMATGSPFNYSLDISTGAKAKDGAAGNQYRFASGKVAKDYKPTAANDASTPAVDGQLVAGLGDIDDAQGVMERFSKLAQPLWSYPVNDEPMVVGTYIAGQQHPDAEVPWNAMFWGFGLEGVGAGGEGTVGRDRLMGDTYNFLAKNIVPTAVVQAAADGPAVVQVNLGPTAAPVKFIRAELTKADGSTETVSYTTPLGAAALRFAGSDIQALKLIPEPGTAAPVYVTVNAR